MGAGQKAAFLWMTVLFWTVTAPARTSALPGKADSLYQAVTASVGSMPVKARIEALEQVLKVDRNCAPACYELAKLYLSLNTPEDRQRAERMVKDAIRLDPRNVAYQLLLGDIIWAKGLWSNALRQYEAVLDKHPGTAEAVYRVGRQAVDEFLRYWDMVNRETAASGFLLRLRPFAEQDRQKAVSFLSRCIDLNPGYRDAYYLLGIVYQETRQPAELIRISEKLLQQVPDDRDALLFCALGYQTLGDYKTADVFYTRALERMDFRERSVMEYETVGLIAGKDGEKSEEDDPAQLPLPMLVLDPREAQVNTWTDQPEDARFWREQDPLFLTDYNERRMVHYGRVAYANLRFGRPSQGIVGWTTDMGKTWIKFGRYIHRETVWGSSEEVWFYEGFSITFYSGNFSEPTAPGAPSPFSLKDMEAGDPVDALFRRPERYIWMGQPQPSSQAAFDRQRPRFVDPYLHQKYSLPHLVAAFRDGDSIRVEISYVIPKARMRMDTSDGTVFIADGSFLFNADWEEVCRKTSTVRLKLPGKPVRPGVDSLRTQYVLSRRTVYVQPGRYHIAAEVVDLRSETVGTFREAYVFAGSDSLLALSDLLLASRIESLTQTPRNRRDLRITPNPLRTYARAEPVSVYFEIYNLTRDVFGRSRYDISYRIGETKGEDIDPAMFTDTDRVAPNARLVVEELTREVQYVSSESSRRFEAFDSGDPQGERTVTAQYEGDRKNDFTYLQIDIARTSVGIHKLTVTVRDVKTGETVEREVLFRVVA